MSQPPFPPTPVDRAKQSFAEAHDAVERARSAVVRARAGIEAALEELRAIRGRFPTPPTPPSSP